MTKLPFGEVLSESFSFFFANLRLFFHLVTIPWIAWGKGVKPGLLESSTVRTMDTAATVVWLLGLTAPADWVGEAVTQAYQSTAIATD